VTPEDLREQADLAWASFPCQDLSLAGNGLGFEGKRSSTFWPFWNLMKALRERGRAVPLVVIENVVGAITANQGRDLTAILDALVKSGYRVGPLVIDAARFVPQSRARLFIIAVLAGMPIPPDLSRVEPVGPWHTRNLLNAWSKQPSSVRDSWLWWRLPAPPKLKRTLTELIDDEPEGVQWHTGEETSRLLALMSDTNVEKVRKAQEYGKRIAGTIYKRIRCDKSGVKVQRAEVRFDQIGGCLRTPVGGSSRQSIILVQGQSIRTRLLSPREAARLMGADAYRLPEKYNEAYHVMGDGLVVPVVQWLERHLLRPIVLNARAAALVA
jgi:DNA (cytosine-5)-methyltransferase 1